MEFPENFFDAIEATVHVSSLQDVYEQNSRVLKPGGTFGVYGWVVTDQYDDNEPAHHAIRTGERNRQDETSEARRRSHQGSRLHTRACRGFGGASARDPRYYTLAGNFRQMRSIWELLSILRLSRIGRVAMSILLSALKTVMTAPAAIVELSLGAENLVAGGKEGMHFMITTNLQAL